MIVWSVPPWLVALACYLAVLVTVWRARTDQRRNGYIGYAVALAWLGLVYFAIWRNWGGLSDNQEARSLAVRLPVLLLIMALTVSDLIALWQARRARGRHG